MHFSGWDPLRFLKKLTIYGRQGDLIVSLNRDDDDSILRNEALEQGDYFLSSEFLNQMEDDPNEVKFIEFTKDNTLNLISFVKIVTEKGRLLGYLEEVVHFDKRFF